MIKHVEDVNGDIFDAVHGVQGPQHLRRAPWGGTLLYAVFVL